MAHSVHEDSHASCSVSCSIFSFSSLFSTCSSTATASRSSDSLVMCSTYDSNCLVPSANCCRSSVVVSTVVFNLSCTYIVISCQSMNFLNAPRADDRTAQKRLVNQSFTSHSWQQMTLPSVLWHCWLGDRKGIRPVKKYGGWWRWALVSPDGVAPSQMVSVSVSVNLLLHHKVQKFSCGTGSPGWSRKKGCKMVVVWWWSWQQITILHVQNIDWHIQKCYKKYLYITESYISIENSLHK